MALPGIDRKFDRNARFFEHYVKLLGLRDRNSIILLPVLDQSWSFNVRREKHRGAFLVGLQIAPRLTPEIGLQCDRYVGLSIETRNVRMAGRDVRLLNSFVL